MKFMVVDDSQMIRNQIARVLGGDKFELVGSAEDGEQAVAEFCELRPRLVTMDLTMPRMNGLDAIEQMVAIDPDVRILVISALKDQDTALEALALGAHGFLCKPFTDYDLVASIEELVSDL